MNNGTQIPKAESTETNDEGVDVQPAPLNRLLPAIAKPRPKGNFTDDSGEAGASSVNGDSVAPAADGGSDFAAESSDALPPEGNIYPSTLAPDDTYRILKQDPPSTEIDRGFIVAVAASAAPDAEGSVRRHHTAIFSGVRGLRWKVFQEQERARATRVIGRQQEARDLTCLLESGKRYDTIPAPEGSTPWTWSDRLEVATLAIGSLACVGIGAFNGTNLLQNSGEAMFARWWQALPFVTVTALGAWGFKTLKRFLKRRDSVRLYGGGLLVGGLACFLAWLGCFSATFSGVLTPVGERLAQLAHLGSTSAGAGGVMGHASGAIMFFGGLAEAALAAGAWICIELIAESHRRAHRVQSGEWKTVRHDLNRVLKHLHEEEALLGLVRGALTREEADQERFLGKATAFLAAANARQQQIEGILKMQ